MITRGIVYLALVLIFYFYCKEEKQEVASNTNMEMNTGYADRDLFDFNLD